MVGNDVPEIRNRAGTTTTRNQKAIRPCVALKIMGVVFASLGRMEIISSSSARTC